MQGRTTLRSPEGDIVGKKYVNFGGMNLFIAGKKYSFFPMIYFLLMKCVVFRIYLSKGTKLLHKITNYAKEYLLVF